MISRSKPVALFCTRPTVYPPLRGTMGAGGWPGSGHAYPVMGTVDQLRPSSGDTYSVPVASRSGNTSEYAGLLPLRQ
jgi:hypothetical protein